MVVFPNAKINIGLNIISRRDDGYHNIESIMIPIPWRDVLEIVPAKGENSTLTTTGRVVNCEVEKNLVMMGENGKPTEEFRSMFGDYMDGHQMQSLQIGTRIIIVPGYEFKVVNVLVTNFHQPQSTLLLLISAFVKGDWGRIYDYALSHDFRFLSYGDSSLLFRG